MKAERSEFNGKKTMILLILLGLFGTIFGIYGFFNGLHPKIITQDELVTIQGTYDHFEFSHSKYDYGTIYFENGKEFLIDSICGDKFDITGFEHAVHKGDVIFIKTYKDDVVVKPQPIEIKTDKVTYLSLSDVNQSYINNDRVGLFLGPILIISGICIMTVFISFFKKND